MTRSALALGLAMVVMTASGCSEYYTDGELFFARSKGADMPIWAKGDLASKTAIIFLHGGPGASSMDASLFPAFQALEEEHLVVYWDQRGSGISQGNPDPSTFTVEQFVEDTDLVVDIVRERYQPDAIFLLGHSWGGALGAAYLSTGALQEKIRGFICVDSGHNLLEGLPRAGAWVLDYARARVAEGTRVSFWQDAIDFLEPEPDFAIPENFFELQQYLRVDGAQDAYWYDPDNQGRVGPDANFIFNSPVSFALLVSGGYLAQRFNILELDLSDDMQRITVPSIVLWGRHDGINTVEMAQDAFDALGTEPSQKSLVIFEESAHQPFAEEPEAFTEAVLAFLRRHR